MHQSKEKPGMGAGNPSFPRQDQEWVLTNGQRGQTRVWSVPTNALHPGSFLAWSDTLTPRWSVPLIWDVSLRGLPGDTSHPCLNSTRWLTCIIAGVCGGRFTLPTGRRLRLSGRASFQETVLSRRLLTPCRRPSTHFPHFLS